MDPASRRAYQGGTSELCVVGRTEERANSREITLQALRTALAKEHIIHWGALTDSGWRMGGWVWSFCREWGWGDPAMKGLIRRPFLLKPVLWWDLPSRKVAGPTVGGGVGAVLLEAGITPSWSDISEMHIWPVTSLLKLPSSSLFPIRARPIWRLTHEPLHNPSLTNFSRLLCFWRPPSLWPLILRASSVATYCSADVPRHPTCPCLCGCSSL